MKLLELARVSKASSETRSRKDKIQYLAGVLRGRPKDVGLAASWLAGVLPGGKLGVGPATLRALNPTPAPEASLDVQEVEAAHVKLRELSGSGSARARKAGLHQLLARCSPLEQGFLIRLWLGEPRQGALESLVLDALAAAFGLDTTLVRRAQMLTGDLRTVAETAARDGVAGLQRFNLELFRPIQPMLAQPAESLEEVFAQDEGWVFERKLDGARVQIHREGNEVRVFSRLLNEVTEAVPEIVDLVRALPVRSLVLDGEVIALEANGRPKPFQTTMRRFGRKSGPAALRGSLPLSLFAFDLLHLDGECLLDRTLRERIEGLKVVPEALQPPRLLAPDPGAAARFVAASFEAGHEGAMAKSGRSLYEAGRRGAHWLKLKQAHTVDLVVLAAEWGSGRRKGWLSNLHLGAPDGQGGFVMLGKTFKGLSDARLEAQTKDFLTLAQARDEHVVHLRPVRVVEIAFSGVQTSPRYPGGLALRFARFRRERPDKTPEQATPFAWFRSELEKLG
ncbi:MAG: ATP-dependent DNA ligase [Myxococcota bacterium]